MKEVNKSERTTTRDELISEGYEPCKNCNPQLDFAWDSDTLRTNQERASSDSDRVKKDGEVGLEYMKSVEIEKRIRQGSREEERKTNQTIT